ncbi:19455_t:CDS:2 [Funneliformis geosporum]|nr:19455_t:CDS:2 [Funneliformis geosporum]
MTDPSKKSARNKILSTAGIGLVTSYWYFTDETPNDQIRKMVDIFEKGKIDLGADMSVIGNLIKREDLEKRLKEMLRISSEMGTYFLIVGEHGTGKTTLVRNTILKLEKPKGVAHFECPSDINHFAKKLAKHLNCELYTYRFRDVIMQWMTNAIRKEPVDNLKYPSWELLSMRLSNVASYYMRKHKRPIILVLDQVDRIAKQDPIFFGILQDFAKDHADRRSIIIVFIATRSAWSRVTIPFEVGDIPDEQAIKFLQDFKIDPKIAEHVVKYLTGGRFSLLKRFLSEHQINQGKNSFEEFKEKLFWETKRDLYMMKLPRNHEFFLKLANVHHIEIEEARSYMPIDMIHKLVDINILKEHQDFTVSFHSRYVDTYFKEVLQATT